MKWLEKRTLLRIGEVQEVLNCSRDHVYDLLSAGRLRASNPNDQPGQRGTRIIAESVTDYLKANAIPNQAGSK